MLRKSLRLSLIFVLPVIAALVLTSMVLAHGSEWNPLSRIYNCYLENAESPDSLPCQDLVNMSGTQPIYDWNEVNQRAGGDINTTMALLPDGHLCSAGRTKYYGLDQTRGDWPMTALTPNTPFTFQWAVTANHQIATFHFFITKTGYNPNLPLKWADLEEFATFQNPTLDTVASMPLPAYQFTTTLPNKTGRQLIFIMWERHDSVEDFYSCNDLWFGAASAIPTATAAPAYGAPEWVSGSAYNAGAIVSHNGKQWVSKWTNSDEPNTTNTSAPWRLEANCTYSGASGSPLATATYVIPPLATATSGPTATPCTSCGPTNTPIPPTATFTKVPATNTATVTRTSTAGPSLTPTRTVTAGPTSTRTRTPTTGPTSTRTATPTTGPTSTRTVAPSITPTGSVGTCSPISATITTGFTKDGSGTFCWQASTLGAYINSWNTTSVSINGTNATNLYIASGSYPAKIGGFWYISYNSTSAFGHFETK